MCPQHRIKHKIKESINDLRQKHKQAYKNTAIETKGVIIKNDITKKTILQSEKRSLNTKTKNGAILTIHSIYYLLVSN